MIKNGVSCYACREASVADLPPRARVLRTAHWRVVHAFDSALPGWLVTVPIRHVTSLAELTAAEDHGRFTIATFELTERSGEGECGTGVGETAKTAFVIEDGLITRWIRVVDQNEVAPPAEGPVV